MPALTFSNRFYLLVAAAIFIRSNVVRELTKSHSMTGRPETLVLKEHLEQVQSESARQSLGQLLPYLLLFVIPMMWTKHDYMLPLTWMVVPGLGYKVTQTVDSKMKSSGSNTTMGTTGGTFGSKSMQVKQDNTACEGDDKYGSYITDVGSYNPGTDDGDAYELKADGQVCSGTASFHDLDSVNLNDKGYVVNIASKNPSFSGTPQEIVPSGV
jgi:hypothetical protein